MASLGPVNLAGTYVDLQPLQMHHAAELLEAGAAPQIWTWLPAAPASLEAMEELIRQSLTAGAKGQEHPFVVLEKSSGRVVGSTRYLEVQEQHRTVEIGWTWYSPDVWGTAVNPEAKYLLLRHAFEDWGALRVQFKADSLNERSLAGIRKLGAKYEGLLRNHRIRSNGSIRHTAMFSIVKTEWPEVRDGLLARLG